MGPPAGFAIVLMVAKLVGAGNIYVGGGYSKDSQQIAPQNCYNATVSSVSDRQGYIHLDTALSFSEMENVLGISVSVSGNYGMFSGEAKARYTRSIKDQDYSLSLNYYQYATNNVAVQLADYGEKALTETGQRFYNGGKNPHFGLICGDHYIASYQQGAFLTMGLNIKFSSSEGKREFMEEAGVSFGDIVGASESVKNTVSKYNIHGSVIIQAFQMGGEPSQLAKILNKDSSGEYYALACSLSAMDNCIKTASGLLDYAKDKFSDQFSTENNTGLTPLGIAFTKYIPIVYIGIDPPPSLVTAEVSRLRDDLFSQLMENEYYQQKLYPFFNNGYPVKLDSDFLRNASLILSKANRNVGVLMQEHGGAGDCFNFPDNCRSIKDRIDSQLRNVTADDLKILEAIKYTATTRGGVFVNAGSNTSWIPVPDIVGEEYFYEVKSLIIGEKTYSYYTVVRLPYDEDPHDVTYSGDLKTVTRNGTMIYIGVRKSKRTSEPDWVVTKYNHQESKHVSPFYFALYNSTTRLLHRPTWQRTSNLAYSKIRVLFQRINSI